jgi:hypothetical protein
VTYPGFTPVGNATLVVANVLTCNKHSQNCCLQCVLMCVAAAPSCLAYGWLRRPEAMGWHSTSW